jgi:hypothetical protein
VIFGVNELILTPFLENNKTLRIIKKNFKFLILLVTTNIFGTILNTQNLQETNIYLNYFI